MAKVKQILVTEEVQAGKRVYWLHLDLIALHDEHVVFVGADGSVRLDYPEDFDVFTWDGAPYEVQGIDRRRQRAWIERVVVEKTEQYTPKGDKSPIPGLEDLEDVA